MEKGRSWELDCAGLPKMKQRQKRPSSQGGGKHTSRTILVEKGGALKNPNSTTVGTEETRQGGH